MPAAGESSELVGSSSPSRLARTYNRLQGLNRPPSTLQLWYGLRSCHLAAGDRCPMPTRVIDIHPHIIASDTRRYPLAPLGGHQSEWSRTRPVTTEQMLEAMDEAGVGKSAMVQASTCYGHDN